MKISELRGIALIWAVSQARRVNVSVNDELGNNTPFQRSHFNITHYPHEWKLYLTDKDAELELLGDEHFCTYTRPEYNPLINWKQGGPIIESEQISIGPDGSGWCAGKPWEDDWFSGFVHRGPTPLVAAMKCYVASKLGDEIEIPIVLQKGM